MSITELTLPISYTGRNYGYITWKKENDKHVKALFHDAEYINFQFPESVQQKKHIDYKKRRVGITQNLTRNIPQYYGTYRLIRNKQKALRRY